MQKRALRSLKVFVRGGEGGKGYIFSPNGVFGSMGFLLIERGKSIRSKV